MVVLVIVLTLVGVACDFGACEIGEWVLALGIEFVSVLLVSIVRACDGKK